MRYDKPESKFERTARRDLLRRAWVFCQHDPIKMSTLLVDSGLCKGFYALNRWKVLNGSSVFEVLQKVGLFISVKSGRSIEISDRKGLVLLDFVDDCFGSGLAFALSKVLHLLGMQLPAIEPSRSTMSLQRIGFDTKKNSATEFLVQLRMNGRYSKELACKLLGGSGKVFPIDSVTSFSFSKKIVLKMDCKGKTFFDPVKFACCPKEQSLDLFEKTVLFDILETSRVRLGEKITDEMSMAVKRKMIMEIMSGRVDSIGSAWEYILSLDSFRNTTELVSFAVRHQQFFKEQIRRWGAKKI